MGREISETTVYVCIDDHSRLSYVEPLKAEDKYTAAAFLERAIAWYRASGIQPRRLLTDNGKVFTSGPFNEVLERASLRHGFTRRYRPHQWQGRALHPDHAQGVGLSPLLLFLSKTP